VQAAQAVLEVYTVAVHPAALLVVEEVLLVLLADNLLLVHLSQHQEQTEQLVNQELQTTDAHKLQQHRLKDLTQVVHIMVEQVVRVAMVGFQLVIKRKK
jgi:hypothetical protein